MITVQERSRLEKFLGMLGSEFDGERANAASMISRMAKSKKITIPELCLAPVSYAKAQSHTSYEEPEHRAKPKYEKREEPKDDHSEFIEAARYIRDNYMHLISPWEQQFVESIAKKKTNWQLTEKQLPIMQRIIAKVTKAVDEGADRADWSSTEDDVDIPF